MRCLGAVLTFSAIQPNMRGNFCVAGIDFNEIFGDANVNFLFDIFIGNRIIHSVHKYVIIILDSGLFPLSQFEWSSRQWFQQQFFFPKKEAEPAAILLLEWFGIVVSKLFQNSGVQFKQRKELLIAQ